MTPTGVGGAGAGGEGRPGQVCMSVGLPHVGACVPSVCVRVWQPCTPCKPVLACLLWSHQPRLGAVQSLRARAGLSWRPRNAHRAPASPGPRGPWPLQARGWCRRRAAPPARARRRRRRRRRRSWTLCCCSKRWGSAGGKQGLSFQGKEGGRRGASPLLAGRLHASLSVLLSHHLRSFGRQRGKTGAGRPLRFDLVLLWLACRKAAEHRTLTARLSLPACRARPHAVAALCLPLLL